VITVIHEDGEKEGKRGEEREEERKGRRRGPHDPLAWGPNVLIRP